MSPARLVRSALLVAALAMTAPAAGCAGPHHEARGPRVPAVFAGHDRSNGKTIRIGVGDRVELILGSTYWKIHGSSAPAVLRQDGPTKLLGSPNSCPPGVGCGSVHTLFAALSRGTRLNALSFVPAAHAAASARLEGNAALARPRGTPDSGTSGAAARCRPAATPRRPAHGE
jgi:hypothetical protein